MRPLQRRPVSKISAAAYSLSGGGTAYSRKIWVADNSVARGSGYGHQPTQTQLAKGERDRNTCGRSLGYVCEMRNDKPLAAKPGSHVWHEYLAKDGTQSYLLELVAALKHWVKEDASAGEITPEILSMRRSEYTRLIKRAEAGLVEDEWNPAGNNPVVWEIKLDYDRLLYRFYFAEPGRLPGRMIGLMPHVKVILEDKTATNDAQSEYIKEATERYSFGGEWDWGVPLLEEPREKSWFDRMRG